MTSFLQADTVLDPVKYIKEWTKHPLYQVCLMRKDGYKLQFAKAKGICSGSYTNAK